MMYEVKSIYRELDQSCIAHYQYSLLWLNSTIPIRIPTHFFKLNNLILA